MSRHDVRIPKWGLSIERMTIVEWLCAVGDEVAEGDPICEVETDKANSEIEAPVAGTLVEITGEAGLEYEVGDVIAAIEPAG